MGHPSNSTCTLKVADNLFELSYSQCKFGCKCVDYLDKAKCLDRGRLVTQYCNRDRDYKLIWMRTEY